VRTVSADREYVCAATDEQHGFLPHMADEFATIRQFGESNALRQIRADRLSLVFSHRVLPSLLTALIRNDQAAPRGLQRDLTSKETGVRRTRGSAHRGRALSMGIAF
jgi:hypothetical protein